MKTKDVQYYAEFDRSKEDVDLRKYGIMPSFDGNLEADIRKNGIKTPVRIFVFNNKALLCEGNHRLMIALRLGIEDIPVRFEYPKEGTIEYDYCVQRESKFKQLV